MGIMKAYHHHRFTPKHLATRCTPRKKVISLKVFLQYQQCASRRVCVSKGGDYAILLLMLAFCSRRVILKYGVP
jgi:hypothetical protein